MIYYYPCRPTLIPPDPDQPMNPRSDYLDSLEETGNFVAEQKWNGDNCLVHTDGERPVFWNRHKARLKYQGSEEMLEELSRWPKNSIINGELLHTKTKDIKDTLIVHCVMAWDGKYLIGKTWGDSREILNQAIDEGLDGVHVQISKIWSGGFWELFEEADGRVIEGIILKDPTGKLQYSTTPLKDVPWMRKVRKPCKKYSF